MKHDLQALADRVGRDRVVYVDEHVLLICARWQDCIGELPCADTWLGDPPYSERTHGGQRTGSALRMPEINYAPLVVEDAAALVEAAHGHDPNWCIFFGDHTTFKWFESEHERRGWLAFAPVFVRENPTPRFSGDGPAFGLEFLSVARPRRRVICGSLPAYYTNTLVGFGLHGPRGVPGQKPLRLMRDLILDYSREGDLILDPCAGGATTLLAARLEGRQCIGVEMDPDTARLAAKRLERDDSHKQTALFKPGSLTGEQEGLPLDAPPNPVPGSDS